MEVLDGRFVDPAIEVQHERLNILVPLWRLVEHDFDILQVFVFEIYLHALLIGLGLVDQWLAVPLQLGG